MKQKGQAISLDFLISTAVIVLALGLLLNSFEITSYTKKQETTFNELRAYGSAAAETLVTSDYFTCEVFNEAELPLYNLPNCIDSRKLNFSEVEDQEKVAQTLGLEDFTVNIFGPGIVFGYPREIETNNSIYSETRNVFILNSSITKKQLDNCIYGDRINCPLETEAKITIRVAKNEA